MIRNNFFVNKPCVDNSVPIDFDWKIYLELNIDVAMHNVYNSEEGAKKHWMYFGCKEDRQYKNTHFDENGKNISKDISKKYNDNFSEQIECMIMMDSKNNPFISVKNMIIEYYGKLKEYNNCLVILGYNINCNIDKIRKEHPNKKIIIYQLEQLYNNQSNWYDRSVKSGMIFNRTNNIVKALTNCDEIWDYDIDNMNFLIKEGFKNIIHKPLVYCSGLIRNKENKEQIYDILFYGSINDRRFKYLQILSKKYKLCIVTDDNSFIKYKKELSCFIQKNIFNDDLFKYINESKIIINLHYYESLIQEQVRIFELLINDKMVVSEVSRINYYGNMIIEFQNEFDILDKVEYALSIYEQHKPSYKFKNKGKIKVGAIYNSFYGLELIEKSIMSIKNVVDYVVLVHQTKSISGEEEPLMNKYIIEYLLKYKIIDEIIYHDNDNDNNTLMNTEKYILTKRNIGLQKCINEKCTYILPLDTDELYISEELSKEIDIMQNENIDTLYSKIKAYYYDKNHYFIDTYFVPSVYKVNGRSFQLTKSSVLVDPVRKMIEGKYRFSEIYMHHYTYLKENYYEKVYNRIGSEKQFLFDSSVKILNNLITWKEGEKGLVFLNDLNNNGDVILDYIDIKNL